MGVEGGGGGEEVECGQGCKVGGGRWWIGVEGGRVCTRWRMGWR